MKFKSNEQRRHEEELASLVAKHSEVEAIIASEIANLGYQLHTAIDNTLADLTNAFNEEHENVFTDIDNAKKVLSALDKTVYKLSNMSRVIHEFENCSHLMVPMTEEEKLLLQDSIGTTPGNSNRNTPVSAHNSTTPSPVFERKTSRQPISSISSPPTTSQSPASVANSDAYGFTTIEQQRRNRPSMF